MKRASLLALLALALSAAPASAADEPLEVVTTLPYLADVARRIGGEQVKVSSLAPLGEDPHSISPTPRQTAALREAKLFIENGVSLEPWATKLLAAARAADLMPGKPGHLYAAEGVRTLDRPSAEAKAEGGHLHSGGNPHLWLDPLNLVRVARNVEAALARVAPAHKERFAERRAAFEQRLRERLYGAELLGMLGAKTLDRLHERGRLLGFLAKKQYKGAPLSAKAGGWIGRALALQGTTLFAYHDTWRYFEEAFGLEIVGTVEEKPGIPPSPTHLSKLAQVAQERGTRVVVYAPYYAKGKSEGLASKIGGRALLLPTQPGEVEGTEDVFAFYDAIFSRLSAALGATK